MRDGFVQHFTNEPWLSASFGIRPLSNDETNCLQDQIAEMVNARRVAVNALRLKSHSDRLRMLTQAQGSSAVHQAAGEKFQGGP
jgi:hypothetical protein